MVTLGATNMDDEPQWFCDDDIVGYDSQGREGAVDTLAGPHANTDAATLCGDINAGDTVSVQVVHDLAPR